MSHRALFLIPIALLQFAQASMVPTLQYPEDGTLLDNGCEIAPNPIVWLFRWSEVPNASRYHLYVKAENAEYPVSDGYIIDRNRLDWFWQVRAQIDGEWGNWSDRKGFEVEPVKTDCQRS